MAILVCGGAGYIGSHTVRALTEQNIEVVVYDNLYKGHRQAVAEDIPFYQGDLRDKEALRRVFLENTIEGVIDFAADSLVGESVTEPLKYYNNNVYGTLSLLEVMQEFQIKHIVFSSTAATYGEPESIPIFEDDRTQPTNPYGETKLSVEKMLKWSEAAYGMKYTVLRYFNAAGAHESGLIGEDHQPESHLIPIVLQVALGQRESIMMFGDDYDTPDGTCVRDYIHVMDLAQAHILAMQKIQAGGHSGTYNLGSGNGFSVKEIVEMAREVTQHPILAKIADRRPGDPATLIASSEKARQELGWKPQYEDIKIIISSAWKWHQGHPTGYESDVADQTFDLEGRIGKHIEALIHFAVNRQMMTKLDEPLVRNQLIALFNLKKPVDAVTKEAIWKQEAAHSPLNVLDPLLDDAVAKGLIGNTVTERDLFDAKIMGLVMPRPKELYDRFQRIVSEKSIEAATDDYYQLSQDSNYIRMDRIQKNEYWTAPTPVGDLEITINLSKPEKDPKEIAKAKLMPQVNYPQCLLCVENVGYEGHLNHPGRGNHRVLPLTLNGEEWYFQYSPYVYYQEHSIIFKGMHDPMHITRKTFTGIIEFLDTMPHYFIGSNADLPIVGGSILSHDHYQGGHHTFPMEVAPVIKNFTIDSAPNVMVGVVKWPLSVLRLASKDATAIVDLADKILKAWREYTDETCEIFAYSDQEGEKIPHNTITPIGRMNGAGEYELDLVLRNNRTSDEHPLGIFHPHSHLHHIKKENIGLIEVMGLAVLPARLKEELVDVEKVLTGESIFDALPETMEHHKPWIKEMIKDYGIQCEAERAHSLVREEVGKKFEKVLECAGVYKLDDRGMEGITRFLSSLN
jgi:UDPglucose--hexose-1-phosphate uridylyltransferase